jgi:hypothetical protein
MAHRVKRFIDLVLCLIVIAVTTSIGLGTTAVAMAASDSAQISTLEDRDQQETTMLNKLEGQIKANYEKVRNVTSRVNNIVLELERHQIDHDELKGKSIGTNYVIAYVTSRFLIGRTIIQEANHLWKTGKVSTALMDYFNVSLPCGDECPIHLARAQRCAMSKDESSLYMEFAAPLISMDLTLVEADAFDLMLRKKDQTCTVKYNGPKNAILSESDHCVYAINVKQPVKYDLILAPARGCMPKVGESNDTRHFSIDSCQKRIPMDEHNFIQIKPYNGEYHVYCPESQLTVEGIQEVCPNKVISFPLRSNFSINHMEFTGSRISLAHQETLDPVFMVKANWHLKPKVNWTSLMADLNEKDDFQEYQMSEFHKVTNYWSTLGCTIAIILLIVVIVYLSRKKNQPVRISVVAQPAQPNSKPAGE